MAAPHVIGAHERRTLDAIRTLAAGNRNPETGRLRAQVTCREIGAVTGSSVRTVSRHLSALRGAGLIAVEVVKSRHGDVDGQLVEVDDGQDPQTSLPLPA